MTHEINIADFAAFCRSKGDKAFDYYDNCGCALAQFLKGDHPDVSVGGAVYSLTGEVADDIEMAPGVRKALVSEPSTFPALADRLEALAEQSS